MTIETDLLNFSHLDSKGPLLGLDLGTRTIGIAVCDPLRTVATPVKTIKRTKFTIDLEEIVELAKGRDAVGLIIGLPRNMDGTEGPRAQSTRAFVRNAQAKTELPFAFWDERLSTQAMNREMIALDTSRARRADLIDQMAATFILQGAIDFMRQNDV